MQLPSVVGPGCSGHTGYTPSEELGEWLRNRRKEGLQRVEGLMDPWIWTGSRPDSIASCSRVQRAVKNDLLDLARRKWAEAH